MAANLTSRSRREAAALLADGLLVWWAWQATYLFRLGFERWLSARPSYDLWVSLAVTMAYLAAIKGLGCSRGLWRYTGFPDVQRLLLACVLAGGVAWIVIAWVLELGQVPRAVLTLHPLAALMALCTARLAWRSFAEHLESRRLRGREPQRPALVLGAGEAARRLIAGVQQRGWHILGLLDDDPRKLGAAVSGVTVLGRLEDAADVALRTGATHLILALPSLRGAARRQVIEHAAQAGLPLLTVPSADELREGVQAARVRDIEPDDLLGREPVALDDAPVLDTVQGKVVLVTGAGGSIGSELCLQLAAHRPRRVVLVDHAEYPLYRIDQRLRERHPELDLRPCLLDIKNESELDRLFSQERPHLVLHAAAYKHVPLVEEHNGWAAVRNNACGTYLTGRVAALYGAARFVLISTDKAVNPTNVMGASKRAAEQLLAALAEDCPGTRFIAVRFGNVLGSSGSVIPRFKEQIARGGPVTVTHPEVIRYFMTIPEACRLVLQAAAIGQTGQVLVMDMGQPVRIVDLARSMIRLSGHREDEVAIVYTGLRPGEKLYEELLADEDTTMPTPVPQLRLARLNRGCDPQQARAWVDRLSRVDSIEGDRQALGRLLMELVPEYVPIEPS